MTRVSILRFVAVLACLTTFFGVSASAGTIIWGGTAYSNFSGAYFVDPVSGSTSPAPPEYLQAFGASSSPYSGWVFVTTAINLWKVPVTVAGVPEPLGGLTGGAGDLAFDAGSGTLYGIEYLGSPLGSGELYTIDYSSCPLGEPCTSTPLGVTMPMVQGIDFVPGRGIYGADLSGVLWFLDPKTLQILQIGDTGVLGITDLAYDSSTQRLIAVSVGLKCYWECGPQAGTIWSIDPLTAQAVLLNDNAPPIYGMAEVVPETGSVILFTTGAVGLLAAIRRRLLC